MFVSYNLNSFGLKLKNIRESMRYTQLDVQNICGINTDTLRRIENGKTIPKYDTLEILSDTYRVDLLNLLTDYRSSEKLYTYYERLDFLISNFNIYVLRNLKSDFENFIESDPDTLVNPKIYRQFELMLEGISKYNSKNAKERSESLETFIAAMKCSITDFDITTFANSRYNIFEMRILLLIALGLSLQKEYKLSNEYLNFLLNNIESEYKDNTQTILLNIKVFIKLSYNYHNLSEDIKILKYANYGIEYCVKTNNMFGLYLLYYRKGIAEFMLGYDNYMDSLHKSIQILEIQGKFDLVKLYKEITLKKYGFLII